MFDRRSLQELLKERFRYDCNTGILYNNITKGKVIRNREAGNITCQGKYREVYFKGKRILTHRVVWAYMFGEFPALHIDHINHDGLDNRLFNLREVTHRTNLKNQTKNKRNTSGYQGVSWSKAKNKWRAYITTNDSKWRHLGYTDTVEEAYELRKSAEISNDYHLNHGRVK